MGLKTPLYENHVACGARIVDFGGWDMPLNYGSQIEEHKAVRSSCGVFDVSHMTVVDVDGADAERYLARLLANDVGKLDVAGKALYSCMLNESGGVIDDLIVYRTGGSAFRLIVNAATREKDLEWMSAQRVDFAVRLCERDDTAMLAVQGPVARKLAAKFIPDPRAVDELRPFSAFEADGWFCARTGYTGEDGLEIVVPAGDASPLWDGLVAAGAVPAGLGARDSLRLEAGLNLYGADMDETTSPFESNLGWTVSMSDPERRFIGRDALERVSADAPSRRLVGLVLDGKGVLRANQRVVTAAGDGETTSGGFSPTLARSIALARIPAETGERAEVEIRGRRVPVRIVAPPFVRKGQSTFD